MLKTIRVLVLAVLVIQTIAANAADTPAAGPASAGYVIGPGDVLTISVWKDDALTRRVTVLPDGGTRILTFDCDEVTDGDDIRQNVRLRRGDVIVVP